MTNSTVTATDVANRSLDAQGLALILHRSAKSIQNDLARAPDRLPPSIRGVSRKTIWLEKQVFEWLESKLPSARLQRGRPTKRQQLERVSVNLKEMT